MLVCSMVGMAQPAGLGRVGGVCLGLRGQHLATRYLGQCRVRAYVFLDIADVPRVRLWGKLLRRSALLVPKMGRPSKTGSSAGERLVSNPHPGR